MTILITLHQHKGCIWGIFVTGIFGNLYTKRVRLPKREFPVALLYSAQETYMRARDQNWPRFRLASSVSYHHYFLSFCCERFPTRTAWTCVEFWRKKHDSRRVSGVLLLACWLHPKFFTSHWHACVCFSDPFRSYCCTQYDRLLS